VENTTVPAHHLPVEVGLRDIIQLLVEYGRRVDELEEENRLLKKRLEGDQ
jgi:hypothetical protein